MLFFVILFELKLLGVRKFLFGIYIFILFEFRLFGVCMLVVSVLFLVGEVKLVVCGVMILLFIRLDGVLSKCVVEWVFVVLDKIEFVIVFRLVLLVGEFI